MVSAVELCEFLISVMHFHILSRLQFKHYKHSLIIWCFRGSLYLRLHEK
jgi:hypothetical protein